MTISYPRPWPLGMGIQKSRFGLSPNQALFASALSRKVSAQSHAAGKTDRWEGLLTTTLLGKADRGVLSALLTTVGVKNTISMFDPDHQFPQGIIKSSGYVTNLVRASNVFTNATFWADDQLTVVNMGNDATLGTDHFSLTPTATNASHGHWTNTSHHPRVKGGGTITLSRRLKANGYNHARVFIQFRDEDAVLLSKPDGGDTSWAHAKIDLVTGAAVVVGDGKDNPIVSSADLTNGWYRMDTTITAPVGAFTAQLVLRVRNNSEADSYVGDTVSGIFCANVQLEEGVSASAVEETSASLPSVAGASQSGLVLNIDGLKPSITGLALTGDYFQLGDGFHKLTSDMDSDSAGAATLDFEPALRVSPADDDPVIFYNPRLIARLTSPDTFWETDERGLGAISFAFEEVL